MVDTPRTSLEATISSLDDLFLEHTPIEQHHLGCLKVAVKREDLYCRSMIAPLAKMRGVHTVMQRLHQGGQNLVGVFDFKVSRAGVGISAMAHLLGMRCIECYQHYKKYDTEGLPEQQRQCQKWGSELFPVQASRIVINFAVAKRHVENLGGYMFPKGIILEETIEAVASEVDAQREEISTYDHIVLCAGSGTISTGLLKGLARNGLYPQVHAVCCTNEIQHCKRLHEHLASLEFNLRRQPEVEILPANQEYYEESTVECPFPAHPNYDRKAWEWLGTKGQNLKGTILFWNIGA